MNAIGMIETNSIPAGIEVGDAMLKAADVKLVTAQAVCAGKYIVMISGSVAAVKAAVSSGVPVAGIFLVDDIVISNVDDQVIFAVSACTEVGETKALGIVETFSLATAVICADAAVKAANVELIEIRLGRGLGGKAFFTLNGDVASVKAAIDAAKTEGQQHGMIANTVVIPSPHKDIFKAIY